MKNNSETFTMYCPRCGREYQVSVTESDPRCDCGAGLDFEPHKKRESEAKRDPWERTEFLSQEKKEGLRGQVVDAGSKAVAYEQFSTDSVEDRFARQETDNLAKQMRSDEWPHGIERPDQKHAREEREKKEAKAAPKKA